MIRETLQEIIKQTVRNLYSTSSTETEVLIEKTTHEKFGDYTTNIAFGLSTLLRQGFEGREQLKTSPQEVADRIASEVTKLNRPELAKIEAVGGYINFFLSQAFLREQLKKIASDENYGIGDSLKGKTVMVEYTDPNPFKLFHIGHLMSNAIGESIARLYEASGAKVIRVNYQGDVGRHVARTIWGLYKMSRINMASNLDLINLFNNVDINTLGQAYVIGSEEDEKNKSSRDEITEINKIIYDQPISDPTKSQWVKRWYEVGKNVSLNYFEKIYGKLGMKLKDNGKYFDEYFFESEMFPVGKKIVFDFKDKKVFMEGLDNTVIFKGENYGLHTRVFVNSYGIPTYEAKELGLNKKKFEKYPDLDLSVIVTGNEITDYFKVLLKVMSLTIPKVAEKTKHVPHGMLRLPTGKMSSRTGDVITAESLIEEVKSRVKNKTNENSINSENLESNSEQIAVGAIKYSILKQSPGKDIIFDFDKSLSVEGDSGPYIQYTYARLNSILTKAKDVKAENPDFDKLEHESELRLVKHLLEFTNTVDVSAQSMTPSYLVLYLYQLASLANSFYETVPVLKDDNQERIQARLKLIETVAEVLKKGLNILGIKTLERI